MGRCSLTRWRHDPVVPTDLREVDVQRMSLAILPALDSLPGLLSLLLPKFLLHVLGVTHRTATSASRSIALLLASVKGVGKVGSTVILALVPRSSSRLT